MKKVLVIDDAALMRKLMRTMFENNGYRVAEAEDGIQGVEQYKKYHPDLVLCDINMPQMGGLECLRQILAHNPKARVIMCTSNGEKCYADDAMQMGAKAYVVKPIKVAEVMKTVCSVMADYSEERVNYKELILEKAGQAGLSHKEALDFVSAFKSMTGVSINAAMVDQSYLQEKKEQVTVGARVYLSAKMSMDKINTLVDIFRMLCEE